MSTDNSFSNWEKNKVSENVYQYYFVKQGTHLCNSIFACIDPQRHKALIIDSAYPEYAEIVKQDLAEQGIEPEVLILSHYHPDHTAGAVVFDGCRIYANRLYEDNHFNCQRWEPQYTYLKPTNTLTDGDRLSFGGFQLTFIHSPGHSNCSMMTFIDNELLHVGDLLMFGDQRKCTLPYISVGGGFKDHIASLERIETVDPKKVLVPHGPVLTDKEDIHHAIKIRAYYLKQVLESQGSLPLEECLMTDLSDYAYHEFHHQNLMQLMAEI